MADSAHVIISSVLVDGIVIRFAIKGVEESFVWSFEESTTRYQYARWLTFPCHGHFSGS